MDETNKDTEQMKENPLLENLLPTTNEDEIKTMLSELDKEQSYRVHTCWKRYITIIVSVAFCAFQLYATLFARIPAQIVRATHLAFVQFLAFLLFPMTKKHRATRFHGMTFCLPVSPPDAGATTSSILTSLYTEREHTARLILSSAQSELSSCLKAAAGLSGCRL